MGGFGVSFTQLYPVFMLERSRLYNELPVSCNTVEKLSHYDAYTVILHVQDATRLTSYYEYDTCAKSVFYMGITVYF